MPIILPAGRGKNGGRQEEYVCAECTQAFPSEADKNAAKQRGSHPKFGGKPGELCYSTRFLVNSPQKNGNS